MKKEQESRLRVAHLGTFCRLIRDVRHGKPQLWTRNLASPRSCHLKIFGRSHSRSQPGERRSRAKVRRNRNGLIESTWRLSRLGIQDVVFRLLFHQSFQLRDLSRLSSGGTWTRQSSTKRAPRNISRGLLFPAVSLTKVEYPGFWGPLGQPLMS